MTGPDGPQDGALALTGTTLRVYRYLYRAGRPCGIHDIQRGLGLSSSSVALYHVRKLLDAGLIRESDRATGEVADSEKGAGGYVVDRLMFDNISFPTIISQAGKQE
ncbi:MAG: helix-turn-helix domain-containing protein [Nitrososphaerales archaeon]